MATFSVSDRKRPAPSRREREISKVMTDSLESVVLTHLYPRSAIDVFVQVLQADGGTRCAALSAASVAIADAGIPMRDLIAGCAAGIIEDQVVLDLADYEDKEGTGDVPLGYSPSVDEVSLLQMDGSFTKEQLVEAVELAKEGCRQVYAIQREALKKKYSDIREEVAEEIVEEAIDLEQEIEKSEDLDNDQEEEFIDYGTEDEKDEKVDIMDYMEEEDVEDEKEEVEDDFIDYGNNDENDVKDEKIVDDLLKPTTSFEEE
jgi:exosome complex component RRP41